MSKQGDTIEGLGPITSAELRTLGLESADRIRAIGWEEALLRWTEAYPDRLNLNAASGLIAVVESVPWQRIPAREKQRARVLLASLRRSRG